MRSHPKLKITFQYVREGATYTNVSTYSLPQEDAIRDLQRTWGTCVWTGNLSPDFKILSIEPK